MGYYEWTIITMPGVVVVEEKKRSHFGEIFWAVQAGVVSTIMTQPLEFMKVQCQIAAEGHPGAVPRGLLLAQSATAKFGLTKLWTGIEPAAARTANYIALRLGIYKALVDAEKKKDRYNSVPVWYKGVAAGIAGGISGFANSPLDLLALRMQADHTLPEAQRRNYGLLPSAISKVLKQEGAAGLWKGAIPNTLKVAALNVGMLAPYDQLTEFMARHLGDFPGIKFVSAYYAAIIGCVLATPFDNMKTKMMRQVVNEKGKLPYANMTDCFLKTLAREGASGFYVGYWMHVAKVGPGAFFALKALEYFNYYV